MARDIPERYRWAARLLGVRPDDHVLEIGCGRAQMVGLICETLASGRVTAIDRSATMVEAARRANAAHIASGKAEIHHQDLLDAKLPAASFNKVFIFNINAFWMDPVSELAEVRRLLKRNGQFFIFHQPPPGHELSEFIEAFLKNLSENGYFIRTAMINEELFTLHIVSHLY